MKIYLSESTSQDSNQQFINWIHTILPRARQMGIDFEFVKADDDDERKFKKKGIKFPVLTHGKEAIFPAGAIRQWFEKLSQPQQPPPPPKTIPREDPMGDMRDDDPDYDAVAIQRGIEKSLWAGAALTGDKITFPGDNDDDEVGNKKDGTYSRRRNETIQQRAAEEWARRQNRNGKDAQKSRRENSRISKVVQHESSDPEEPTPARHRVQAQVADHPQVEAHIPGGTNEEEIRDIQAKAILDEFFQGKN